MRILIIEDNKLNRNDLIQNLNAEFENLDLTSVTDKQSALDFHEYNFDIVISDIQMPVTFDKNIDVSAGYAVIERVRQKNDKVHIIAWTVTPQNDIKSVLKKYNCHYVRKNDKSIMVVEKIMELITIK